MSDEIKKDLAVNEQDDNKEFKPTEEQVEAFKNFCKEQATKLGEIYAQCWESEEFKAAFIEDPKAIFEEYGVNYRTDKEYEIIDTPDKTVIHVLPYDNAKVGLKQLASIFEKQADDIPDGETKQILLEGWKYMIYQNTENKIYLPIPICPEKLSPEELEMVNGGCLIFSLVVFFEATAAITTVASIVLQTGFAVTTVSMLLEVAVAGVAAAAMLVDFVTVALAVTAQVELTGAFVLNNTNAVTQEAWSFSVWETAIDAIKGKK